MTNSPDFDALQLYFGEPFVIHNEGFNDIIIKQPTIDEIVKIGERQIYSVVNIFIANTTLYRVQLWDIGIDWNKLSDFSLFCMLINTLSQKSTQFLFEDLDFQLFKLCELDVGAEEPILCLYNEPQNILIDEKIYTLITSYIKNMFNIHPKVEKAKGKTTKEWMIFEDRQSQENHKNEPYKSTLLPLISSCLNHPGFKYKKNELREVGIVEFMDSVQRLQIYESSTALLKGVYGGFIDVSKINQEELNFMREITRKN